MKPRDIFGIILRCVALWITVWGAWQLTAAIARAIDSSTSRSIVSVMVGCRMTSAPSAANVRIVSGTPLDLNSAIYFVYGLPGFLGGLLVLRFADTFVGFTYRRAAD